MAAGGAFLVLVGCLCGCWHLDPGLAMEVKPEVQISPTPQLVGLVRAAAEATVAAGYINDTSNLLLSKVTKPTLLLPALVPVVTSSSVPVASSAGQETVLIVGDTRYGWQDWSSWHCNCKEGSMSRVRDITYSVPGVRLDPKQYDVLRFERAVCSYAACQCSREQHQCDRLEVTCNRVPAHMCALLDIEQDQEQKRKHFWVQVHEGLKKLWHTIRETFPAVQKPMSKN